MPRTLRSSVTGCAIVRRVSRRTSKRLRLRRGRAELVPENPKYRPVDTDADTAVMGVVVGLVREFVTEKIGGPKWAR